MRNFRLHSSIVDQKQKAPHDPSAYNPETLALTFVTGVHLFDLQAGYVHAVYYVWKESHHIIIAHGHVGNNLF